MMIICAPDSFKECLPASAVAHAMMRGVHAAAPDAIVDCCPIADGGEGTVDALVHASHGMFRRTTVVGPVFESIAARWGLMGQGPKGTENAPTAVIEMAAASGLELVPMNERDPGATTTYGTGQLIGAALRGGVERIILGIGGSGTNDGGVGMAIALGARVYDKAGREMIDPPPTGATLHKIHRIDMIERDPALRNTQIIVACDVTNPLTGPNGAAHIYGPQKGATPEQVIQLDEGLEHLAELYRDQLGVDVEHVPGAGAAGGLGAGLMAFTGATLQPGIGLVLDAVHFSKRIKGCDLCLTGEGKLDGQSMSGKACIGVAQAAAVAKVPTIALVGTADGGAGEALKHGLKSFHVIGEGLSREESIRHAEDLIAETTARVVRGMK